MFLLRCATCRSTFALAAAMVALPAAPSRGDSGEVLLSYHRDGAGATAEPVNPLRAEAAAPSYSTQPPLVGAAMPYDAAPISSAPVAQSPSPSSPAAPPMHAGASLASYEQDAGPAAPTAAAPDDADADFRRLAPRTANATLSTQGDRPSGAGANLPVSFPAAESLTTALGGLAVVVGLFLTCAWLFRRGGSKQPGALPSEAFTLLGVAPLAGRTVVQLIRLGNKLVLLAIAPEGVQTLAEVTDPAEVDRLAGLCAAGAVHGPTAEFQQVLAQLAKEPARGFLGREAGRR